MAETAEYYRKNKKARQKRLVQQTKYNKTDKGKSIIKNAQKLLFF